VTPLRPRERLPFFDLLRLRLGAERSESETEKSADPRRPFPSKPGSTLFLLRAAKPIPSTQMNANAGFAAGPVIQSNCGDLRLG
jgi:hypothetical protein